MQRLTSPECKRGAIPRLRFGLVRRGCSMERFTLPFTDAELYLAPRWGVGGVFVALISLALVLWLYRYELRLVSRRAAFGLLALRVLVVLVLLCVVFVQPMI